MLGWQIKFYKVNNSDNLFPSNFRSKSTQFLSWDIVDYRGIDFLDVDNLESTQILSESGYPILVLLEYSKIRSFLPDWFEQHKLWWIKSSEPPFVDNEILNNLNDNDLILIEAWDQS